MHRQELKTKEKVNLFGQNHRRDMEETTWEQAEGFAVSVIREARIKAKFWFTAWLVTFVVLITVVAAVLVM